MPHLSFFSTLLLFSVTGNSLVLNSSSVTRTSTTATPRPSAARNSALRPHPGDCHNVDDHDISGADKWKNANADKTLGCFKSQWEKDPSFNSDARLFDESLAYYYGFSNPDFQCSINPTTPVAQCQDDDRECDDLQPLPLKILAPNSSEKNYSCDPTNTDLHHKATGWVVRQSMLNLHAYFGAVKAALDAAIKDVNDATGPNGKFKNDFTQAPIDKNPETRVGLAIMNGFFGMLYAGTALFPKGAPFEGLAFGTGVTATIAAGGASLGMANATAAEDNPDLQGWVGNISQAIANGYYSYSDNMFRQGYVTTDAGGDKKNTTLLDLFSNGTWAGEMDFGGQNATAVQIYQQGMYAALAQRAWTSQDNLDPFIAVWPGDCKDPAKLPKDFTSSEMPGFKTDFGDVSATVDGDCYSLLGSSGSNCPTGTPIGTGEGGGIWGYGRVSDNEKRDGVGPPPCCGYEPLKGASNKLLTGGSDGPYGGLKLTDMIQGAVAGWKYNKKVNGYSPWNITTGASAAPSFPQNLTSVGVVSAIPICDYTKPEAPGLNCPNLYKRRSPWCSF